MQLSDHLAAAQVVTFLLQLMVLAEKDFGKMQGNGQARQKDSGNTEQKTQKQKKGNRGT